MERVTECSGEGGAHPGYCASPELHRQQGAVCLHSPVCLLGTPSAHIFGLGLLHNLDLR